ncbi:hypothetical protein BV898_01049 [Hypsibius exemplaris]|uniref:SANTA domain-containing protein n=1 Tax=Hypsibius exemplaris TaxID=2072580 RepID=A0A1W0XD50_HYPEX|nr:hypothetical protein BV898_01049 [Hypsibius exemplaris]
MPPNKPSNLGLLRSKGTVVDSPQCRAPSQRPQPKPLHNWHLAKFSPTDSECCVRVVGFQQPKPIVLGEKGIDVQQVTTSRIKTVHSATLLITFTGSLYQVQGAIDEAATLQNGFPKQLVRKFIAGFPANWEKLLGQHWQSLQVEKKESPLPERMKLREKFLDPRPSFEPYAAPASIPDVTPTVVTLSLEMPDKVVQKQSIDGTITKDVPETLAGKITKDVPETVAGKITKDVPETVAGKITKDIPETVAGKITKDVPETLAGKITKDVPETLAGKTTKDVPETLAGKITEDVPETLAGKISEDVPETLAEGMLPDFVGGLFKETNDKDTASEETPQLQKEQEPAEMVFPKASAGDSFQKSMHCDLTKKDSFEFSPPDLGNFHYGNKGNHALEGNDDSSHPSRPAPGSMKPLAAISEENSDTGIRIPPPEPRLTRLRAAQLSVTASKPGQQFSPSNGSRLSSKIASPARQPLTAPKDDWTSVAFIIEKNGSTKKVVSPCQVDVGKPVTKFPRAQLAVKHAKKHHHVSFARTTHHLSKPTKKIVRTAKWFAEKVPLAIIPGTPEKKNVAGLLFAGKTGDIVANKYSGSLEEFQWEDEPDSKSFVPRTYKDTTKCFRLSVAYNPNHKRRRSTIYQPSNANLARDKINFRGFLDNEHQQKLKKSRNMSDNREQYEGIAFADGRDHFDRNEQALGDYE